MKSLGISDKRWLSVAGILTTTFFVATYVYNSFRFDRDSLIGDQWYWVENVLLPFEHGQLSLFDAVTSEYANLSHSHIPTLAVFLLNARVSSLDLTVDAIVGVLSLIAVLALIFRHLAPIPSHRRWAITGAAASLLFLSASSENYVWSLLQFQMLYILIAVAYLYSYGKQIEEPRLLFAIVVMPLTLALGDAIGVAAVVAGLCHLSVLMIVRRVPWRRGIIHLIAFPFHLVVLGSLLTGTRKHGGQSFSGFLETSRSEPTGLLSAGMDAMAGSLVGFVQRPPDGYGFFSWDRAWFGLILLGVVLMGTVLALTRSGVNAQDHFPVMLMIASGVWSAGVLKSRFWALSEDALHASRYVSYLTLLGVGALLIVGQHWPELGRMRPVLATAVLSAVAANAILTLGVSLDADGERRQGVEIATLEEFVKGQRDAPVSRGFQCTRRNPCLETAWFLWDEGLGPFAGEPSGVGAWVPGFRAAVFDEIEALGSVGLTSTCPDVERATRDQILDLIAGSREASWEDGQTDPRWGVPDYGIERSINIYKRAYLVECNAYDEDE